MKIPVDIQRAIQAYYAERATPDDVLALEAWFRENEAHLRAFAEHGMIEWQMLCEHEKADAAAILTMLREAEQNAEPDFSLLDAPPFETPASGIDRRSTSFRELVSLAGYVVSEQLRPRVTVAASLAAVLAVGLVLMLVLVGPDEVTDSPGSPDLTVSTPSEPTKPVGFVVATLTAEHDAVWDRRPGQDLYPGQRFTLISGFAEITTLRGAKALLQAPATIETIYSDNAIRLHRGKLVGRCETPGSKGFVVHTPGVDVVDLGTEFGVEVDQASGCTVLVMSGSVRVQPTEASPHAFEPVVLRQDDARRVDPETGGLETIAVTEAPVFYADPSQSYFAAVMAAEPVAYWRFDEARAGEIVNAAAPGRHDLRVVGSAMIDRTGLFGNAGRIDRLADSLGFFQMDGELDEVSDQDTLTFECWFRAETVHHGTLLSFYQEGFGKIKHVVHIELQPDYDTSARGNSGWMKQAVRFADCSEPSFNAAAGTNIYSNDPYSLGSWHHVVAVKESGRIRLYLDGELTAESDTGRDIAADAKISLGLVQVTPTPAKDPTQDPNRPLHGWIDEVAVYSRALDANEIRAHWSLGKGLSNVFGKE